LTELFIFAVTAQEGPGTVIVYPGQDVELLCNVTGGTAWLVNTVPYGINALLNGILPGYSSNGMNIIVENVMMNDSRNGSNYRCVVLMGVITNESKPTYLYVAGE